VEFGLMSLRRYFLHFVARITSDVVCTSRQKFVIPFTLYLFVYFPETNIVREANIEHVEQKKKTTDVPRSLNSLAFNLKIHLRLHLGSGPW